jgi:hypothetical protein
LEAIPPHELSFHLGYIVLTNGADRLVWLFLLGPEFPGTEW